MGMPTISVFIRKDDLDKFKALPNKSEFLHNALNYDVAHTHPLDKQPAVIKTKEDVIPAIKQVFPDAKFEPLYRDKKNKRL